MANFAQFFPFILRWEGGYVNDPNDSGGPTRYGVTLAVWKQHGRDLNHDGLINVRDVQLITPEDANMVAKKRYWDVLKADDMLCQEIAAIIVDWGWTSGPGTATLEIQRILNLKADGVMGKLTVWAINQSNPVSLFQRILRARLIFIERLVIKRPKDQKFKEGWLNRLQSLPAPQP